MRRRRGQAAGPLARSDLQRSAFRGHSHDRRRPVRRDRSRDSRAVRLTSSPARKRKRRSARTARRSRSSATTTSSSSTSRREPRDRADHGRRGEDPERQDGLGVRGGDLRARTPSARTGGAPTRRAWRFCRIDDTPVSTYVTLDDITYDPKVETWDYPRAGDPNPIVEARRRARDRRRDRLDRPVEVRRRRLPDRPRRLDARQPRSSYEVQNRTQTWLDLNAADVTSAGDGDPRTLLRETSPYWINSEDTTLPTWLKDGSFLWLSERSGCPHPYHYTADGTLVRQVTTGKWELRTLHGVDETQRLDLLLRHRAQPDRQRRLPHQARRHRPRAAVAGRRDARRRLQPGRSAYYIDTWSDVTTPPQTRLHRRRRQRTCASSTRTRWRRLAEYTLSTPEFLQVKTRDGFVMEAMMIKPPDFDPSRRYPVYQFTYGGPHAQQVRNAWTLAVHVSPAARAARRHRLDLRQPDGERQGRRVDVAGVQAFRRARAARHRGRPELAEAAAVRRRIAHRHSRLELRRLHDRATR